ncbi:Multidomain esterase [termite gut metagenome]|uniref:Multidomain esterase n=1 Tax=termite gut metagenome TaxID=433724 RepID=A0A5J4RJN7_9ZZZZ
MAGIVSAQQKIFPSFPPDSVTSLIDRNQMMEQLGIRFPNLIPASEDPNRPPFTKPGNKPNEWTDDMGYLPQSPVGYIINRTDFGLWLNYTEKPSQVGVYTPVNLLKTEDGTAVTSPGLWWNKRRPEVERLCQQEIWGVIPQAASLLKVSWDVQTVSIADSIFGKFEVRELTGNVDISSYPALKHQPQIKARLFLPVNARNVPVIIQYAWFSFPPHPVYIKECISRGWGFMQMDCNALQPDNGGFLTDYLIGLVNKGNWRKPEDWGTLAAWSWGISRLIDYFETDDAVDAKRIGITGHSRYGKAALVTMAYEPRLATAYVSCSGVGGTAPLRRHWGEDIENVAWESEYHWLAGNFMKWIGPLKEGQYLPRKSELLPVDAHTLLSLCAPRPVLVTGGTRDSWTDPYGMFLTCRDASPVYQLLGEKGVVMEDASPIPDKDYTEGNIAYRYHEGGHVDFLDWPVFAKWAEKILSNPNSF